MLVRGEAYVDKLQIGFVSTSIDTPGKLEVYCVEGVSGGTYFDQRNGGAYTTEIQNRNLNNGTQANILELVGRQPNGVTKRLQVYVKNDRVIFGGDGIHVVSDFSVGGTKSFRIDHPLDDDSHIFHSAVEGPGPGGNVYRISVTTVDGIGSADLPDYFSHINKDVTVMCQANEHFGRAYGTVSGNTCTLHSDVDGDYHALVMGTRCDAAANKGWKGDVRKK
jgi:hypothetical protein